MNADRWMRVSEVAEKVGLKRQSIYRLIARGEFPKQHHPYGSFSARWSSLEVEAWFEASKDRQSPGYPQDDRRPAEPHRRHA